MARRCCDEEEVYLLLLCCALGLVLGLVPRLFSLNRLAVAKLLNCLALWHVEEPHRRNADCWVEHSQI